MPSASKKKVARRVAKPKLSPLERVQKMISELNERFYERATEILCFFVCLLSREHLLLLGPRGSGKTALCEVVTAAIKGASYFETQLTMFSTPEELFGGVDISAIQKGVQRRDTRRMLPEAEIAVVEEVYKGNASILNSMLTLLQSRKYNNGPDVMECPLETMVGTSNELVTKVQDGMEALDDRFMVRVWTSFVSPGSFQEMWGEGRIGDWRPSVVINLNELHQLQEQVLEVEVPDEIAETMAKVREALLTEAGLALQPSDRKYVQCREILQAHALLDGRDVVTEDDILFLQHVLWDEPLQRPKIAKVLAKTANPLAHDIQEIMDVAIETYRAIPFGTDVPDEQSGDVYTQCSQAIGQFSEQIRQIEKKANGKAGAIVKRAILELKRMTKDAGNFAAQVSGVGAAMTIDLDEEEL